MNMLYIATNTVLMYYHCLSSYGDKLALAIGAGVSRFPRRRSCSVSSYYYVIQSYMYVLYVYTWRMECARVVSVRACVC